MASSETERVDMNTGEITHWEFAKSIVKCRMAVGTGCKVKKLVLNNIDDF